VANVSQGTTVTWGGTSFGEVVSVSVDAVQADTLEITPKSNKTKIKWYYAADRDNGTVSVTCRSTTNYQIASVGLTAALSIGSPGVSWSFPVAIYQGMAWSASVGELQTYTVTFKLGG